MNPEVPVNGYIVGYGRFIPEVYREILGNNKLQYTIHKLSKVLKLFPSIFSAFSYWLVLLFHQFSNTSALHAYNFQFLQAYQCSQQSKRMRGR